MENGESGKQCGENVLKMQPSNLCDLHVTDTFNVLKVIRYPDPQVFVLMNSFKLIVVHINWEIEIVAATRPASENKHALSLVPVQKKMVLKGPLANEIHITLER